jgi:hypothetical protein
MAPLSSFDAVSKGGENKMRSIDRCRRGEASLDRRFREAIPFN